MVCDTDLSFSSKIAPSTSFDHHINKNLRFSDMKPLKLNQPREVIRLDAILEAAYEPDGAKRLQEQEEEAERAGNRGIVHMFGYKHDKALKFYGQLLRCLRDCYDGKFE